MEETKQKETVTKRCMVAGMQNYTDAAIGARWSKDAASLAFDAFVETLKGSLMVYGKVCINGLGTFEIKTMSPKTMINNFPNATVKKYLAPEKNSVRFKPSKVLKENVAKLGYGFSDSGDGEDGEE